MSAPRLFDKDVDQLLLSKRTISLGSVDAHLRSKILLGFWGQRTKVGQEACNAYFHYFTRECEAWRLSGCPVAIQTYRDLLELVEHLRNHRRDERASPSISSFFPPSPPPHRQAQLVSRPLSSDQMLSPLSTRFSECERDSIKNAIDLAVCLWLMLNIATPGLRNFPGRSYMVWRENESLNDFIERSIPKTQSISVASRWPQPLNLYNLERIGGFEIVWTDHLADHLFLDEDLGTIKIYHHAYVLQSHQTGDLAKYVICYPSCSTPPCSHPICLMVFYCVFTSPGSISTSRYQVSNVLLICIEVCYYPTTSCMRPCRH